MSTRYDAQFNTHWNAILRLLIPNTKYIYVCVCVCVCASMYILLKDIHIDVPVILHDA